MRSAWVTIGWVGFGASGGLLPELRLGLVALGCCRGAIGASMRRAAAEIAKAVAALRDKRQ